MQQVEEEVKQTLDAICAELTARPKLVAVYTSEKHTVDKSSPRPASKRRGGLREPMPGECRATSPLRQQIMRRRNPLISTDDK
jgi:hypothetical protein